MKTVKNIKQSIRKLKVQSSDKIHERILDKLLIAMDKSKNHTATVEPIVWRMIMNKPIAKIAAAAVIIIAISLFFMQQEQPGEIQTQQIAQASKSPGELTTFASLTFAYRQGGMEMVEQMCDKALRMAGPRPTNVSMYEF